MTGIGADHEHDGNRRGGGFGRERRRQRTGEDDRHPLAREFGRLPRQAIVVALRPAVFDGDGLALDISRLTQGLAQRGDGGKGHPHRTADAVLALIPQIAEHGARDVCARTFMRPGERVRLASAHQRHQFVVGGVKLHEINAVTEAVVRAQLRQMPVGLAR